MLKTKSRFKGGCYFNNFLITKYFLFFFKQEHLLKKYARKIYIDS